MGVWILWLYDLLYIFPFAAVSYPHPWHLANYCVSLSYLSLFPASIFP